MSKSAICTVNSSTQNVAVDGLINPGTVIRRFGPNLNLVGEGIQLCGAGYYNISANFNVVPTTEGEVTITAYLDNTPIPGAVATETAAAAGDVINLSISSLVRQKCECCNGLSSLTFVLTGTASGITNNTIIIQKL